MTKSNSKKLKFVKEFILSLNLNKTFEIGFEKQEGSACAIEVYEKSENKSIDFKLLFNSDFFDFHTELELKAYLLHEIGHLMTSVGPNSGVNEYLAYEWSYKKAKELKAYDITKEIKDQIFGLNTKATRGDASQIYAKAYKLAIKLNLFYS
jgi:hypothetical protein